MNEYYYVTIKRDQKKIGFLAGPYASKEAAERMIPLAQQKACNADPWADFDAFGVTKLTASRPAVAVFGILTIAK